MYRAIQTDVISIGKKTTNKFKVRYETNQCIYVNMIGCYSTVPPSSLSIENVTPASRLLGTEGHDLTMSCNAEGVTPSPSVVLIIDRQRKASQNQSVGYTLTYTSTDIMT